ncbi:retrovirus-related pol polyprotein from transposon TNT 1-94, partial [Tanacetum coccineum]
KIRESPDVPLVEELVSDDKLEKKTVFPTAAKIEFVRLKQQEKPVKYAEMYSFDHVQANYNYHQRERVVSGNNYTMVNYNYSTQKAHPSAQSNMVPRVVLIKTGLRLLNTAKPVNTAHPKTTVYSARPMPNTTVVNAVRENQVNAVKASACWGHLQKEDEGYVDSGCSRHMTRNMSYLSNFKEFDEGYVTFGGGAKRGKITATKDETSGILKSFITEIENLVDKKVKIIRCDNETEFKNKVMSKFCEHKGIKREFSIARTPQQNGIAERRNKTLIEAARTMLADSILPTTFWAEAVNTACYVQNRVLVVKPHIKTPYELFRGSLMESQMKILCCTQGVNTTGPSINTEPDMFSLGDNATLEATHADFFGDETEVDMSNITTTYLVPSTPNTRIHKDHSLDHVIGDVQSGVQTRRMTKTTNEQGFISAVYEGKTHEDLHTCLFACFLSQEEPKRIAKALSDSAWVEAMQEELLQFKLQKVWVLVDLPKGKRAIGTKWVFRNKKDERGIVIRNKARLVAQGHTQEEGIDYDEVFSPVAKIEAIRLFLAYASFMRFMVYQMDVKSAFLYGRIKEEVYVYQPLGFEDPDYPDKVYKVVKALYGLHQAPRAWSMLMTLSLALQRRRLQVKQKEDGIFISQDKHVAKILRKFSFTHVRTASTTMDTKKLLLKDLNGDDVDVHLYMLMIGSLMYLTSTRPDIMFAVCACARFQVSPKVSHLHDVKRIFRYLKGQPKLVAYSDSDYDRASLDRKFTTGDCQFLGCRLISWQCKKQTVVATSSTEAKYMAVTSCCGQDVCTGMDKLHNNKQKWVKGQEIPLNPNTHPQLLHYLILNQSLFHHYFNPKRLKDLGKPKRATERSQSSGPIPLVANETVIKEWEDIMERAATTASSLEAEQDSGNINRTQSMATLNESFPQGTGSGSGPRCQDTILGDAEAQIRFEAASKQSNDPPLSRVNTLRSGEDSMKLKELMEHYTKLSELVSLKE